MRVTNERAQADAWQKCSACHSCDECEFASGCHESKIYAADLLEARELIKEMRDLANLIHEVAINPVLQASKTGREESIVACEVMSEKIIEKSKEPTE